MPILLQLLLTSSAPTNTTAIRSVVAFGEMHGGITSAYAEAAYIQPLLPDDIQLCVTIPDSLLTPAMKAACLKVPRPVFRLRRPLYGWSRSASSLGDSPEARRRL